ncbi:SIR2 family protein [Afipia sp. GAS231]|uniref:SIR2 family protein n=1 Tax=Afipia sp. GAS231 TaxID=1882747 RepID=UPI00087B6CC8|nr:SIR2 family protein [Afipia sp. GAS231]SDP22035.1 SIR2-like domain-containing protein [Afipia sp. GAS231]
MSDEIPLIPSVPQGLREAAQRGTLIPFVGAGASVLAGCPTWGQLADGALKACIAADKFTHGQMDQIRHLTPRMKISIARAVEAEHGLRIDYGKLVNPRGGYKNNEVGRRVYRSLGKLGQTFVTTNYDAWLDNEISEAPLSVSANPPTRDTAGPPRIRRRIVSVEEFTPANLNQPNCVVHLHGSLADPSGMVMTTRDYIRRYANDRGADDPTQENRTLTFLESLFQNKTVLFVGYGLEDLEILEYVIQKARQQTSSERPQARHFMLQGYFAHEYELMRSLTQYYAQCDIELIPFRRDLRDWAQLTEVLEAFATAIPATTPLALQVQMEMESYLEP